MSHRRIRTFALAAIVLVACTNGEHGSDRNTAQAPAIDPAARPVHAFVAHRDPRSDAPSFVWLAKEEGVRFGNAHEAAATTMKSLATTFGLSDGALASVEMHWIDESSRGPIIARLRQRARGIEVFRGGLSIAMNRAFEPVSASGFLARSLAGADRPFVRATREALESAFASLPGWRSGLGGATANVPSFSTLDIDGDYERFSARFSATPPKLGSLRAPRSGTFALANPARVKRVFYPQGEGVIPAYYVEIEVARGPAYSFVVSATDGRVLFTNNLVRNDAFEYRAYADATTKIPLDGPQGNAFAPFPGGKPNGMKPTWGVMNAVTLQSYPFSKNDPWLPADATTLTGNNVHAYDDLNPPDGIAGDSETPITGPKQFDNVYDTTLSPGATPMNLAASATHLFYVTNFLHDWYYDLGFDEKSGNHQTDNFGRGGTGHDPLKAEAQDYAGRNNSDAAVPADGASPRLQMYVFSGPSFAELKVLTPAALAGSKSVGLAGFGKDQFDTSGTVVLAKDDQGSDSADGCEPLTNNVTGMIVLVHRGVCSFVQKAQNAQDAGALGVVVANVSTSAQPTVPPFMGGTSPAITVPILSLNLADGQALEAAIPGGTTVEMHRLLQTDLDGALDTSIVAHEWGHVISGRLINDGNGLTTNQSGGLGEGWADFSAQQLMVRADDIQTPSGAGWAGAYPTGAYATSGAGTDFYFGIRRVPYSIDFAKDPLTFKHIADGTPLPTGVPISFGEDGSFNSEVHSTGEVWATMLWECYAALLEDSRHSFADAQTLMRRYYVASLKLTPPDPTLLEARDAVLAAALANDEQDYKLFWGAFGRRGAGVGALGPAKDSPDNRPVTESFYVGNDVQIMSATIDDSVISCDHDGIIDEGEVGLLTLIVRNSGPGALTATTAKLSSAVAGVSFLDGDTIKLPPLKPFASTTVKARLQIHGAMPTLPIAIDVAITDPSFPAGRMGRVSVQTRFQADEAPNTSAFDHVDTVHTAWTVSGEDTTGATKKWSRVMNGLDGHWTVPNPFEVAEHRLTSPAFEIDGTTFELSFKHRWSFRISTHRMVDIDGGVVEVSVDRGKTWNDLSMFGKVDYNTTLDTGGRGDNALKGRPAYGNKSPGYPDTWVTSHIKVDLTTHPEHVMIRFHMASGTGFSGAPGWDVDDIDLIGLSASSTPFWSFIEQTDQCDPNGPTAIAGDPVTVKSKQSVTITGSGTHPKDLPLAFEWLQVSGRTVSFMNDGSPVLKFDAPDVGAKMETLTFALRANDGKLLSPQSRVDVTVVPGDPVDFSAGGGGCSAGKRTATRTGASSLVFGGVVLFFLAMGVLARRRARSPRR
jgi:hypothetical protein